LIFALFQNGVEWSRSTATRMAHLEGRLGRPIPALMTAVEITIMLARVEGRAFIEHPFTRFVLAGVVVFLAIVVITICFEGPRPEGAPHARDALANSTMKIHVGRDR